MIKWIIINKSAEKKQDSILPEITDMEEVDVSGTYQGINLIIQARPPQKH